MDVGAGVEGKDRVGAGVREGAVGVLGSGTCEEGVFADKTEGEDESVTDLSLTGVGGGALAAGLADD